LLLASRPDWVIVVGDVDSTLATALAATKLGIPTAHLEAGLRSFDRTMPEEINRVVTDAICDLLWTPSPDADENLRREGIPASRVERVGNVMIDCLEMLRPRFQAADTARRFQLAGKKYGIITMHRPSNVDHEARLGDLLDAIERTTRSLPLLFPLHPRTRMRLTEFGLMSRLEATGAKIAEPLGYIDFMSLVLNAAAVITDSGGLQEETTYLGIPCFTLRENTERPITITQGTNQLTQLTDLPARVAATLTSTTSTPRSAPQLWDGRTAGRVLESLARHHKTK
jgi:UDP-N-acetylglucosamine 2-epimerase (non-hydrolysing)